MKVFKEIWVYRESCELSMILYSIFKVLIHVFFCLHGFGTGEALSSYMMSSFCPYREKCCPTKSANTYFSIVEKKIRDMRNW